MPEGSKANYTLRGYLIATTEGKGAKVTYIWDVNDASGQRVARVSGEEVVAGRAGRRSLGECRRRRDPQHRRQDRLATRRQHAARQRFGKRGGRRLGSDTHRDGLNAAAAAGCGTGAKGQRRGGGAGVRARPGDGTRSLTTALKKRLYAGGVKLANGTTANVYMVKGTVSLADASGGKQSIRIDWQVLDPSGKKLGTVSQQNTIPRGSLNGPWGAIADAAAGAAATGIIKLLPKSS